MTKEAKNNLEDDEKTLEEGRVSQEKKSRGWGFKLLLLGLAVFVSTEVGLRFFCDYDSRFNIFIGAGKEWDPERRVRLKKNYHSGDIHTNSKGIVGREFEGRKRDGVTRVLNIGDSCSFIPPERTYPSVIEEKLRAEKPDHLIEVINACVPGYDSAQALSWYETELINYDHDIVIIYLGWNDMGQYNPDGLEYKLIEKGYLQKPNLIQQLFASSYILRSYYVYKGTRERSQPVSLTPLGNADKEKYETYYPYHFESNVKAIIELAQSKGKKVYLLNYAGLVTDSPTEKELARMHFPRNTGKSLEKYKILKGSYDKALSKISTDTNVPIIDIESLFESPERREVFTDSMHFNKNGAEVIGSFVSDQILPQIK